MDSSISKFTTIEKLISSDIDHWLCNLYFEIVKIPKYVSWLIFISCCFSVLQFRVIFDASLLVESIRNHELLLYKIEWI